MFEKVDESSSSSSWSMMTIDDDNTITKIDNSMVTQISCFASLAPHGIKTPGRWIHFSCAEKTLIVYRPGETTVPGHSAAHS